MADERPAPTRLEDLDTHKSVDYRIIYVNGSKFALSPTDVGMTLLRVTIVPPAAPYVEEEVTAYMSPQQAKTLMITLTNVVQQYESQFGEIKVPLLPAGSAKP